MQKKALEMEKEDWKHHLCNTFALTVQLNFIFLKQHLHLRMPIRTVKYMRNYIYTHTQTQSAHRINRDENLSSRSLQLVRKP